MTSRDFAFWLQGYFEIRRENTGLTADQTAVIKAHLSLVFKHEIDPAMGGKTHQDTLNTLHNTTLDGNKLVRC